MANSVAPGDDVVELIGESVERREDQALVTGEARYMNDFDESQMPYAAIHRSLYGHACIDDIDTSDAVDHEERCCGVHSRRRR